ncbi:MAG: hydroxymethylbilane synthase [Alphaproteobacteria bacterium TMED194]|nr:MAG: hydroxymethylbilane synthase [Alphaproteobacteria bacterium TMED194]
MINKKIIIASRSSTLAKTQTELVVTKLKLAGYNNIEKVFLKSKGDTISKTKFKKFGGKGLFTEEIDKLIIKNEVHLGVHSAKDIPAALNKKLSIGAYIKREDVRDILITKDSNIKKITHLPKNSTLGTSSPRRAAYIKLLRPDLKIVEIRGNIETRIQRVLNEKIFSIILARAGLNRIKKLQFECNFFSIPLSQILPAPGQGAIAITYNKENIFIKKICKKIDCLTTRVSLNSERSLIKRINGDCFTPIAALAVIKKDSILLKARLFSKDYKRFADDSKLGPIKSAKSLGKKCAESLLKKLDH